MTPPGYEVICSYYYRKILMNCPFGFHFFHFSFQNQRRHYWDVNLRGDGIDVSPAYLNLAAMDTDI